MPARNPSREALVLVALLVVLVAVVAYQLRGRGLSGTPGQAAQGAAGSSRSAVARDHTAAVPDLRLSALRATAPPLAPSRRNPFVEPPQAPPPSAALARPTPESSVPPGPPPITLKLVAIVQGSGRPLVALTDGRDVFYGREGDVIEGRYKIVKVNVESIDISYVDGRGQRRLGLAG